MRAPALSLLALLSVGAACAGSPESMPDGVGRGLLRADDPPDQGPTWSRPVWAVGNRFSLVRGEQLRGTFEVVAAGDDGYVIDAGGGRGRTPALA